MKNMMHRQIIGYVLLFVVVVNCTFVSARRRNGLGNYNNAVSKRKFQLNVFCSRRCNVGKGGLLCSCNGFHFAGKRTSNKPLADSVEGAAETENAIYDLLARNLKIKLGSSDYIENDDSAMDTGLMTGMDNAWTSAEEAANPEKRTRSRDGLLDSILRAYMETDDDYSL